MSKCLKIFLLSLFLTGQSFSGIKSFDFSDRLTKLFHKYSFFSRNKSSIQPIWKRTLNSNQREYFLSVLEMYVEVYRKTKAVSHNDRSFTLLLNETYQINSHYQVLIVKNPEFFVRLIDGLSNTNSQVNVKLLERFFKVRKKSEYESLKKDYQYLFVEDEKQRKVIKKTRSYYKLSITQVEMLLPHIETIKDELDVKIFLKLVGEVFFNQKDESADVATDDIIHYLSKYRNSYQREILIEKFGYIKRSLVSSDDTFIRYSNELEDVRDGKTLERFRRSFGKEFYRKIFQDDAKESLEKMELSAGMYRYFYRFVHQIETKKDHDLYIATFRNIKRAEKGVKTTIKYLEQKYSLLIDSLPYIENKYQKKIYVMFFSRIVKELGKRKSNPYFEIFKSKFKKVKNKQDYDKFLEEFYSYSYLGPNHELLVKRLLKEGYTFKSVEMLRRFIVKISNDISKNTFLLGLYYFNKNVKPLNELYFITDGGKAFFKILVEAKGAFQFSVITENFDFILENIVNGKKRKILSAFVSLSKKVSVGKFSGLVKKDAFVKLYTENSVVKNKILEQLSDLQLSHVKLKFILKDIDRNIRGIRRNIDLYIYFVESYFSSFLEGGRIGDVEFIAQSKLFDEFYFFENEEDVDAFFSLKNDILKVKNTLSMTKFEKIKYHNAIYFLNYMYYKSNINSSRCVRILSQIRKLTNMFKIKIK